MKLGISVVIITLNEEKTIERSLTSVFGLVNEIILVDTGSTDNTVKLAKSHPAKPIVFEKKWSDNFAQIRNYALSLCNYTWCLVLDGDEYIDESSRTIFTSAINEKMRINPDALYAPLIDSFDGSILKNNPRIFKIRDSLRYRGRVHEYLHDGASCDVVAIHDIVIKHTGYLPDVYSEKNKHRRNLTLLRRQIQEEPDNFRWKYFLLRYVEKTSPESLSVLNDFAKLPLPYPDDIEVYALNIKFRFILALLSSGEFSLAVCHAAQLRRYYNDYDTTLLYISAKLKLSHEIFENNIKECSSLLNASSSLPEDEYLHEKLTKEFIDLTYKYTKAMMNILNIENEK